MWAAVAVAALALANGAFGYQLNVVIPEAPPYGSTVELEAIYTLEVGEHIRQLTWSKDGVVFLTYNQRPNEVYSTNPIDGINMNVDLSSPEKVVLEDVGDGASGDYSLKIEIITEGPGGGSSTNQFHRTESMVVGGTSDTLGNRFGGSQAGAVRPAGRPVSTTLFSSSTSSGTPDDGELGNRFGGAQSTNTDPGQQSATALDRVQLALQQAQDRLQGAINQLG